MSAINAKNTPATVTYNNDTVEPAPMATATNIESFIKSKIPAPTQAGAAIDTSHIILQDYRSEDADINAIYTDFGWREIKLVDEQGEIVPNARLQVVHKSGKTYSIVPFFPLVLTARKSTLDWSLESRLEKFAQQGSMKEKGNTYKFVASKEQLDAMAVKAEMNYQTEIEQAVIAFNNWLGSFHPTVSQLELLYICYQAHTTLIHLGDKVFIRQDIPADSQEWPVAVDGLELLTEVPDLLGDTLISTRYTYQLG